jgi:nicotinate-nucleotide adenylyltransferase
VLNKLSPPSLKDPHRWRGLRVGLFGGSFNPPHAGHVHVARLAQIKFDLDFVWWIVSPQNPLKSSQHTRPYAERYNHVEKMLSQYPRQMPTHIESQLGTGYTYETISGIKQHFPHTDFVWICGMDNAHIFHKWEKWQDIVKKTPVAFIARPPATDLVKSCPLRMMHQIDHKYIAKGLHTDLKKPAIYWLSGNKMLDISSTKIRKNR